MQNLHFLCQTLILFAKAVQFCRISFLTPLRFSRAKRLNLKPPSFQLSACYSKLLGYAALRCARLIKPINGASFKLVGICSSMLSHLVPLSWTGVKYPTVRQQARSSDACREPDLRIRKNRDHAANPRASSSTKPASTPSLTLSLRPFSNVISI